VLIGQNIYSQKITMDNSCQAGITTPKGIAMYHLSKNKLSYLKLKDISIIRFVEHGGDQISIVRGNIVIRDKEGVKILSKLLKIIAYIKLSLNVSFHQMLCSL
jgi:hypothetical protein